MGSITICSLSLAIALSFVYFLGSPKSLNPEIYFGKQFPKQKWETRKSEANKSKRGKPIPEGTGELVIAVNNWDGVLLGTLMRSSVKVSEN